MLEPNPNKNRLPSVIEILDPKTPLEIEFSECGDQINN